MTFDEVVNAIDDDTMNEYEDVRSAGFCNMFDSGCVANVAARLGYRGLEEAANSDVYVGILENFTALMEYYGVEQE